MSPGMTYLPRASMTLACAGTGSSSRRSIALIRPFSIQIDRPSRGFSATPSMTVAPEMSSEDMVIGSLLAGRQTLHGLQRLLDVFLRAHPADDRRHLPLRSHDERRTLRKAVIDLGALGVL